MGWSRGLSGQGGLGSLELAMTGRWKWESSEWWGRREASVGLTNPVSEDENPTHASASPAGGLGIDGLTRRAGAISPLDRPAHPFAFGILFGSSLQIRPQDGVGPALLGPLCPLQDGLVPKLLSCASVPVGVAGALRTPRGTWPSTWRPEV